MKNTKKIKTRLGISMDALRKELKKCAALESRLKRKEAKLDECKKVFEERLESRTATERIINKQLRSEIELRKQLEQELYENEMRLAEAQRAAHLGSWEYIVATRQTRWSEEEFRIFGLKPTALSPTYEEHLALIHPDDRPLIEQSLQNTLRNLQEFKTENKIIRPDGTIRFVQNTAKPVLGKDGKVEKIAGTTLDITELQERTAELNNTRQRLESIVDGIKEQIILVSKDFKILWANKTFLEQFRCTRQELSGNFCYAVTHNRKSPCQPPNDICPILASMQKGEPKTEVHIHHGPGGEFFSEVSAYPIKNDKGEIVEFVHISRDVTERKKTGEQLRALSLTDELTGLANRRGFLILAQQQLKVAKRNKQDMGLLFADLDNLKWINDTFGHQEGDRALIEAAGVLTASFRESDIVARVGGDEFAVLAIQASKQLTDALNVRLQTKLDEYNAKAGRNYPLSLSFGLAYCVGGNPCLIDELISGADALMYENKRSKKNKQLDK